jgi:hypothetical protein
MAATPRDIHQRPLPGRAADRGEITSPPPPLHDRPDVRTPAHGGHSHTDERLVMKRETRQSRQKGRPHSAQRRVVGVARCRLHRSAESAAGPVDPVVAAIISAFLWDVRA